MSHHGAGGFFILGFDGMEMPKALKKICERYHLAGVILFDRNIDSPEQVRKLTAQVKSLAPREKLFISIDQEGGRFQRFRPPHFTAFPPACEVQKENALDIGRRMGKELADLGINVDFAPVLDVNTNPRNPIIGVRSFGADPEHVTRVGELFIQGLHENGVLACGKHFPGHGDTDQDSHRTLPVVRHPLERLEKVEIFPFHALIRKKLRFLMSAHVLYPALDPENPATFSSAILTDLLRGKLGFRGVVTTDDMGMAGSLSQGDLPDVCIQAFAAGCDLLLVCEHHERHPEVISRLEEAIRKSKALQKRAEESLERIHEVRT